MLIRSHEERIYKRTQNRYRLLKFLRDETWSDALNLGLILGLSKSGAYKTLSSLCREQLIISVYIEELGRKIYGITPSGLLYAWDENENMENRSYFQPNRVKPLMMRHHLDLQLARVNAERAGWNSWKLASQLPKNMPKRPDAEVTSLRGQLIAVELERTVKTKKRYESIFSIYLQAIKRSEYDAVHYVCPDQGFAKRLLRLFTTIDALPVAGVRVPITDRHREKFPVYCLENWPPIEKEKYDWSHRQN